MSHLWEKEEWGQNKKRERERTREGGKKGIEKKWKEGRNKGRSNKEIGGKIRRRNFNKN